MIKIKNLNKSFGDLKVISNLNLDLPLKKLIFITGVSGSGKSTLLKIIAGYEKPNSGTVEIAETNLKKLNSIDYVFQDYNLFKGLNALENMQVAVNTAGLKFDKKEAVNILNKMSISKNEANTKIENLSGGEQQRIAIARSILRNSKILLMDEPTGNLDFENSETIFQYLKEISKNKTVVVVTHDLDNAKKYGDILIEINENEIVKTELKKNIDEEKNDYQNGLNLSTPQIKNKNKFSLISKFLKVDIRKKFFQMILVILILITTITSYGTLAQYRNGIEVQTSNLKTSFLEADRINVYNQKIDMDLSQSDVKLFEKLPNVKYFTENYFYQGASFSYNDDKNYGALDLEFINFDEFYKNRMIDNVSMGSFPVNDNEIIISKNIVSELEIENPIGKSILFVQDVNNTKELKITAVNDVIDINGKNYSYISNQFLKKENEKLLSSSNNITLWKNIKKNVKVPFFDSNFSVIENVEKNTKITTNTQKSPKFPKLWISEGILKNETIKLNQIVLTDFFQRTMVFEFVGIIETKEKVVAVSQDVVDNMSIAPIYSFTLFLDDNTDANRYILNLENQPQFEKFLFSTNSAEFIAAFTKNTIEVLFVFEIILFILMIVSIVFVLGFTKIMNDAKKQDIGVLKSLGGSLKQILMYQISYFVLINIITLIISILVFVPIQMVFSTFLEDADKISLNYWVGYESLLIIWSIIFATSTVVYSLYSCIKFRKSVGYLVS